VSVEPQASPLRYAGTGSISSDPTNLADLLERILDKGIVIAGDISISLVDIELLTIKLRLLIASVDRAQEMGINWWRSDPWLSGQAGEAGNARDGQPHGELSSPDADAIQDRLERIETALEGLQGRTNRESRPKRGPG
jgi:Gas vesicle protein